MKRLHRTFIGNVLAEIFGYPVKKVTLLAKRSGMKMVKYKAFTYSVKNLKFGIKMAKENLLIFSKMISS